MLIEKRKIWLERHQNLKKKQIDDLQWQMNLICYVFIGKAYLSEPNWFLLKLMSHN